MVLLQAARLPNGPLQFESVGRSQAVSVATRAGYCSRDVGLSLAFFFNAVGPGSEGILSQTMMF